MSYIILTFSALAISAKEDSASDLRTEFAAGTCPGTAIEGANQIGAFSPGSVKFINRQRYVGPYAGEKGNSFFFTLPLPVSEFGCAQDCLSDLVFDVQMRYIDCPTSVTINGSAVTVNRGWQFIISKTYALWVQPTDAYAAGDPLANTNGTLRYVITNA